MPMIEVMQLSEIKEAIIIHKNIFFQIPHLLRHIRYNNYSSILKGILQSELIFTEFRMLRSIESSIIRK